MQKADYMHCSMIFLYKVLEHPRILVSAVRGVLKSVPCGYQGTTEVFLGVNTYMKISNRTGGGGERPLTTVLFKGQLYIACAYEYIHTPINFIQKKNPLMYHPE